MDGLSGLRQTHTRGQTETEGIGRHTGIVGHRQSRTRHHHLRKCTQRNGLPLVVDDIQVIQRGRVLQIRSTQFKHHPVLVEWVVNGADLSL